MRILIVEDEEKMRELLRDGLREHGHTVIAAGDGEDGLALAGAHEFDVIVLDVMLPQISGMEVAARLRSRASSAAVLMLTACDAQEQIIEGLERGADDYLTKPFSFPELLARIKSITRRSASAPPSLRVGDLVLDAVRRQVFRAGVLLDLTRTEHLLLECLMKAGGKILPRQELIESVWGRDRTIGNSTLDAFINLLRNKVDAPFGRRIIRTVKGVGYCLNCGEGEAGQR